MTKIQIKWAPDMIKITSGTVFKTSEHEEFIEQQYFSLKIKDLINKVQFFFHFDQILPNIAGNLIFDIWFQESLLGTTLTFGDSFF